MLDQNVGLKDLELQDFSFQSRSTTADVLLNLLFKRQAIIFQVNVEAAAWVLNHTNVLGWLNCRKFLGSLAPRPSRNQTEVVPFQGSNNTKVLGSPETLLLSCFS